MKRCPYCAEKIKDEAVKCRFCGEWLDKGALSEEPTAASQELAAEVAATPPAPEPTLAEPEPPVAEETVVVNKEGALADWELDARKKLPLGWGWLVVLALFSASFKNIKTTPLTDTWGGLLVLLPALGFVLVLVVYFWLRRTMVRRRHYALKKASGWAGFVAWFVVSFVIAFSIGLVKRLDSRAAWSKLEATSVTYMQSMTALAEEEAALWDKVNLQPATTEETKMTIQHLQRMVAIIQQRRPQWATFLREYKRILESSENPLLKDVLDMEKLAVDYMDKYKKGLELYISYFTTGDEASNTQGSELISEAMELSEKVEALTKKIMK
jgi:hypothetical protein